MADEGKKRAVLIAGPTASGKTAMAIERAREWDALIVNADSMQVYDVLDLLTARPDAEALAAAPHRLFGHVAPSIRYSTGAWLEDVAKVIQEAEKENQELIFVGGTGLYFEVLLKGFAPVPPIPQAAVKEAEKLIQGMGPKERRVLLRERDPETAARVGAADPQRVVRALSVLMATGRTLSSFQQEGASPMLGDHRIEKVVLMPERAVLRARIAERFAAMIAAGAIGEVERLRALDLDPSLPAMKAIGVREIGALLDGHMSLQEAVAAAVTATRQYAKRQSTWFRNRMADWTVIDPFSASRR